MSEYDKQLEAICKEWDAKKNSLRAEWNIGQRTMIEILLAEIKTYDYTTVEQINGALHSHFERLKGKL